MELVPQEGAGNPEEALSRERKAQGEGGGEGGDGEQTGGLGGREGGTRTWRMSSSLRDRILLFSSRSSQGKKGIPWWSTKVSQQYLKSERGRGGGWGIEVSSSSVGG